MRALLSTVVVALGACTGDGGNALTEERPEPAGDNCAAGGTAVVVGVDEDGSGTLSDAEIEETVYVCHPDPGELPEMIVGDVYITSEADAERYVRVIGITGNLTVRGTGHIVMPSLTAVGGSVRCEELAGAAFELPLLVDVGLSVSATDQCPVPEMPELETVGLQLTIVSPTAVPLALGRLRSVGNLTLLGLATVDLPVLETAAQVMVQAARIDVPALRTATYVRLESAVATFNAPMLTTVETLWAAGSALTTLSMPSLAMASNVEADNNTSLLSVSLPSLTSVTYNLRISGNPVLTSLDAPQLTSLMYLTVTNNPMLPRCMATQIEMRTGAFSNISGNGNGMCP